ncbi:MAG: hypothetical protein DME91_05805, partial [Verrucomicrobia bacterium]
AILGCLERFGLSDKTIVVHTSDHGDSLGAHHLFGKEVMFEEAARVPLLIRLPGQKRGKVVLQPVSHIDFVPTLLDLLGQPNHPQCAGKSLLPLINEEAVPPQNVFLEWAPNRTKVKKGTKLARRRTWEARNLYEDRQYAPVISRLTGEIHRWQESANDKLRL